MKLRNMFLAIAVAAVAGISTFNANNTNPAKQSDLQMENVELLAEAEWDACTCVPISSNDCECRGNKSTGWLIAGGGN